MNTNSIENNFRKIVPYTPGDQPDFPDMIKLNTNESPYPPSPKVIEAGAAFDETRLKLYPSPDASDLRKAIASYHGFAPERVFVGVGSDDVLSMIFQSCFNSGLPILFPEVTYSFYDVWADLYRIEYRTIPLRADFTIDCSDYIGQENGGIVIANPNAPTSIVMPLSDIEAIAAANQGRIVVIDEAYIDFGGESALQLLDKYDNLIVVRTYSKSRSLAGLRIGYAISSARIIRAIEDVKYSVNSYPMNRPSIEMGVASIEDEDYFRAMIAKVVASRKYLTDELEKLGFTVLPSSTNFLFVTHRSVSAEKIYTELKERHIFVRHFKKPLINDYLRITIGTDEQCAKVIEALKEIIC
ncbi:MAG: histidinol-phosphate transaminase [Lachnospiraceae bacterium]|nr:histidinol-phosphate transaminase [Lachnospiraceae bacterium]